MQSTFLKVCLTFSEATHLAYFNPIACRCLLRFVGQEVTRKRKIGINALAKLKPDMTINVCFYRI